jgi:cytochrome c553
MISSMRLAAAALLMATAFSHVAVSDAAEGDPAAGKRKTVTCNACHGQSGFKSMPKLGGQGAVYLVAALRAYKEDERVHATMRDVAHALSEKDIADLAAHYAAVPIVVGDSIAPSDAVVGRSAIVERCAACHGALGSQPSAPEVALIAGQNPGYLDQALREYKSGARLHPLMQELARELDDQQIAEVVAWFARQKGLSVK